MFFNLIFLGKDANTNEDKIIFKLSNLEINLEIYADKKKYFFLLKDKTGKDLKSFSLSDKKLGNNKSAIEIRGLVYNDINKREELFLNLGYNGASAFIYSDKDGINIELINPIGETVKNLLYYYDDLFVEED
jgi:hypothetical protein